MTRTRDAVVFPALAAVAAGLSYYAYGLATAETRMKATCAAIAPGMTLADLKRIAADHGLMTPRAQDGVMYLAETRSYGRHACKVTMEKGLVKQSEHNYAD